MKAIEQRKSAAKFAKDWAKKKGNEKKETQKFWNDLLENVYGVKGVRDFIFYEDDVKVGNATKWIDASIPTTKNKSRHGIFICAEILLDIRLSKSKNATIAIPPNKSIEKLYPSSFYTLSFCV